MPGHPPPTLLASLLVTILPLSACTNDTGRDSACVDPATADCLDLEATDCSAWDPGDWFCDDDCGRVWACWGELGWHLYTGVDCACVQDDGMLVDTPECDPRGEGG